MNLAPINITNKTMHMCRGTIKYKDSACQEESFMLMSGSAWSSASNCKIVEITVNSGEGRVEFRDGTDARRFHIEQGSDELHIVSAG